MLSNQLISIGEAQIVFEQAIKRVISNGPVKVSLLSSILTSLINTNDERIRPAFLKSLGKIVIGELVKAGELLKDSDNQESYGAILSELGNVYIKKAEAGEQPKENYKRAIGILRKATEVLEQDKSRYATVLANLEFALRKLVDANKESQAGLRDLIGFLKIELGQSKKNQYKIRVLATLRSAYLKLKDSEMNLADLVANTKRYAQADTLRNEIAVLSGVRELHELEREGLYLQILVTLASDQIMLADIEDQPELLREAINNLKAAVKLTERGEKMYNKIQSKIGEAYYRLSAKAIGTRKLWYFLCALVALIRIKKNQETGDLENE
jgi:predicted transcriptional regulator